MKAIISFSILILLMFLFSCKHSIAKKQERYENGGIKSEYFVCDGVKNGISSEFDEDGHLQRTYTWMNGKKSGIANLYYNGSNSLKQIGYFKNDTANGPYCEFYTNGKIKIKGTFVNGIEEGYTTKYYMNGSLKAVYVIDSGETECSGTYDSIGNITSKEPFFTVDYPDTVSQGNDYEIKTKFFNLTRGRNEKWSFYIVNKNDKIHWDLKKQISIDNDLAFYKEKAKKIGNLDWYAMLIEDSIDENGDKRGQTFTLHLKFYVKK